MVSFLCSICHLRSSSTGVRRPTPAPHPVNNHQQPPLPCFCSFGTSSLFFLWFLFDKQLSTSLHSIPAWANDTNPCLPCTLSILWFCFSDFYKRNSSYVALHAFKKRNDHQPKFRHLRTCAIWRRRTNWMGVEIERTFIWPEEEQEFTGHTFNVSLSFSPCGRDLALILNSLPPASMHGPIPHILFPTFAWCKE